MNETDMEKKKMLKYHLNYDCLHFGIDLNLHKETEVVINLICIYISNKLQLF